MKRQETGETASFKEDFGGLQKPVAESRTRTPGLLDYSAARLIGSATEPFMTAQSKIAKPKNTKPGLGAELLAEFLGTCVLMLFGIGVVAMVVLFPTGNAGETIHGGYTNITLAWGLAVTMGIYIAGKISGAHLNPAVTLALAVFRQFPWRKVLPYSLAQIAGAFCAAALVYWNYLPAFHKFDPALDHTAGIFTTFPAFPAVLQAGFLDQVIGTALLLLMIFAITDEFNSPPGANMAPLMVGLVVIAIGMSFGGMHGYAINPARDFGPRLFTAFAGFHNNGLTDGIRVWWIPIVAPLLGGLIGAATFDWGIRPFLRRLAGAEVNTSPK